MIEHLVSGVVAEPANNESVPGRLKLLRHVEIAAGVLFDGLK